ncbi:MAG: hypothetical protein AAFQ21_08665 [Pseudomonadota bacterium]
METKSMNLKKLLMASAAVATAFAAGAPAQAKIVDNPHFKVLGIVIVWGGDSGGNAVVGDFIIDDDTSGAAADTDLIAGDVNAVVTGALTPLADSEGSAFSKDGTPSVFLDGDDGILDATDTLTALTVDDTIIGTQPEYTSHFFVASNTAFNIDAETTATTEDGFTLADIGYELDVTVSGTQDTQAFGGAAQTPADANSFDSAPADLEGMEVGGAGAQTVFAGAARTASSAGTIAAQSVRFDATYTLGTDTVYGLHSGAGEVEATVEYTVYVP